jgi:hypothetical protein
VEATVPEQNELLTRPAKVVAALCTVYQPRSHADVIVSKLLADYTHPHPAEGPDPDYGATVRNLVEAPLPLGEDGRLKRPRVAVASMFVDQIPENDLARAWSVKTGVPLLPTIHAALTLGTGTIAVDGVLIIGEHGEYPLNERGQRLYPRRRWFDAVADVVAETGRPVPVFIDKHLGVGWEDADHIVTRAAALGIPLMAGSSVSTAPLFWRAPRVDLPLGARVRRAVVVSPPPLEAYGFHALEALQSVVERRAGGETGVSRVRCLTGDAAWDALGDPTWGGGLFTAAMRECERARSVEAGDVRALAPDAHAILIDYRDGTRGVVALPADATPQWAVALACDRDASLGLSVPDVLAFRFGMGDREPFSHFAWLLEGVQDMIETGTPSVPVARTLLTTGTLDFAMASHVTGGDWVDTPDLSVSYSVTPRERELGLAYRR